MRLKDEKGKNTFICALNGIVKAIKTEKNLRFDIFVALLVICLGFIFRISSIEWIICIISIGLMLFAELMNTAIEATVDLYTREKNEQAGLAKDIAAGAVLIMAINISIVGMIIFLPKILNVVNVDASF